MHRSSWLRATSPRAGRGAGGKAGLSLRGAWRGERGCVASPGVRCHTRLRWFHLRVWGSLGFCFPGKSFHLDQGGDCGLEYLWGWGVFGAFSSLWDGLLLILDKLMRHRGTGTKGQAMSRHGLVSAAGASDPGAELPHRSDQGSTKHTQFPQQFVGQN